MKNWFIAAVLILLGGTSFAQSAAPEAQPRRYAVLSLLSDVLNVVNNRGQAGSHLSTSSTPMKLSNPAFDRVALLAVNDILKQSAPGNAPVLLAPTAALYAGQGQMIDGMRFKPTAELQAALKAQGATHLLLISKHRDNVTVQLTGGTVGSGKVEGLGFYLDHHITLARTDSGATGEGFMAPYTYFAMSLVDLQSNAVVKSWPVTATRIVTPANAKDAVHAWDVLTSEQKMDVLKDMLNEQVKLALGKLLAG
jgi:hypothetical protein